MSTESGFGIIHRSLRGSLTAYQIAVYVALTWRTNSEGTCWVRHTLLAAEAGMSRSKVIATLNELRDLGEVSWEPRYGPDGGVVCNTYTVARLSGGHPLSTSETPPIRDVTTEVEPLNETPGTTNQTPSSSDADDALLIDFPAALQPVDLGQKFEQFWNIYPRRVGKAAARKAFLKAARTTPSDRIIESLHRQLGALNAAKLPGKDCRPHPTTWLNQGRWDDDIPDLSPSIPSGRGTNGALHLLQQRMASNELGPADPQRMLP